MNYPQVVAIVVAGGRGHRMGREMPKQYLPLDGRPILWHTLSRIERSRLISSIILVLRSEDREYCQRQVLDGYGFSKIRQLVHGRGERHESVYAGLRATVAQDEIVVVHDAVRPFVSQELLQRVIDGALEHGAAIAGVEVAETIKKVADGRVQETPERGGLRQIQTPQAFRRPLLLRAHQGRPPALVATDDAVLVEALGHEVRVVEGEPGNIKITTPSDLAWAEWLVEQEEGKSMQTRRMRVGQGVDVHAFAEGRKLVLGGLAIPFARGLAGHSDADVLTHAIIDALLGATGGGDIGRLFPDSDLRYKDISSLVLLGEVRDSLAEKGATILNIDAVIMAQKPKLAPHLDSMANQLATVLELAPDNISLKATTTEKLGFVGREEGIMAQAVALVEI
ncbi:MAG: bifunctional 2-C-methyl-D-erythritol 4-phosphate cytidylyltransferase/2-C-methyl-D-erythritol 2,4-cyclodiphosphate synthase [Gemmatimonadetes bacterium]|nr:bifunctional 2-C-methyl-D-erythritol 4-phosphate cytidylyltransferase/2-C-methyl-D-erythritol 2,4-cyclodiphosphate synthase [Gemmatimonadota bacterium]